MPAYTLLGNATGTDVYNKLVTLYEERNPGRQLERDKLTTPEWNIEINLLLGPNNGLMQHLPWPKRECLIEVLAIHDNLVGVRGTGVTPEMIEQVASELGLKEVK